MLMNALVNVVVVVGIVRPVPIPVLLLLWWWWFLFFFSFRHSSPPAGLSHSPAGSPSFVFWSALVWSAPAPSVLFCSALCSVPYGPLIDRHRHLCYPDSQRDSSGRITHIAAHHSIAAPSMRMSNTTGLPIHFSAHPANRVVPLRRTTALPRTESHVYVSSSSSVKKKREQAFRTSPDITE